MKKIISFALVILICILLSCKEEKNVPTESSFNYEPKFLRFFATENIIYSRNSDKSYKINIDSKLFFGDIVEFDSYGKKGKGTISAIAITAHGKTIYRIYCKDKKEHYWVFAEKVKFIRTPVNRPDLLNNKTTDKISNEKDLLNPPSSGK